MRQKVHPQKDASAGVFAINWRKVHNLHFLTCIFQYMNPMMSQDIAMFPPTWVTVIKVLIVLYEE